MGFIRLFMSKLVIDNKRHLTRPGRAIAGPARCLWKLSKTGKIDTRAIFREIT